MRQIRIITLILSLLILFMVGAGIFVRISIDEELAEQEQRITDLEDYLIEVIADGYGIDPNEDFYLMLDTAPAGTTVEVWWNYQFNEDGLYQGYCDIDMIVVREDGRLMFMFEDFDDDVLCKDVTTYTIEYYQEEVN